MTDKIYNSFKVLCIVMLLVLGYFFLVWYGDKLDERDLPRRNGYFTIDSRTERGEKLGRYFSFLARDRKSVTLDSVVSQLGLERIRPKESMITDGRDDPTIYVNGYSVCPPYSQYLIKVADHIELVWK